MAISQGHVDDHAGYSKHEDDHAEGEDEAGAHGEVNLSLDGEQRDGEAHGRRDARGDQHDLSVIETCYGRSHVGESQREDSETYVVARMLPSDARATHQSDVRNQECSI